MHCRARQPKSRTTGNAYVLSKGAKGVGFYKLSSTGTIGANKAYLTYSGAGAREFFPIEGNVTGIEMPKAEMTNSDAEVYDLQGRQAWQTPPRVCIS